MPLHAWNPTVLFLYRNFKKYQCNLSHVGLGNNALMSVKVLRKLGIHADLAGVWTFKDCIAELDKRPSVNRCVIEAIWLTVAETTELMFRYPGVQFAVRNHSQIGFLQVEAGAIAIGRGLSHLQEASINLRWSANNERFCQYWTRTYRQHCLYLPNLYTTDDRPPQAADRAIHSSRTLRVSSFGSLRLLKNHTTACAAALAMARRRSCDLEFHINIGREEHGKGVHRAIVNMTSDLPWVKLVTHHWMDWTCFRQIVAHMDICLQPSFTETFNLVSADACAEGVPSVVGEAIEWCPAHWMADTDNADEIARIGNSLLDDPFAAFDGRVALAEYCVRAQRVWLKWLDAAIDLG